jgi:sugar lactone lactonase YvrE
LSKEKYSILDCQNALGEGPAWSADEQRLYWVDIEKSDFHVLFFKYCGNQFLGLPGY